MKRARNLALEITEPKVKKVPVPPLSLLSAKFVYTSAAGTTPEYLRAKFASIRKAMDEAKAAA